MLWFLVLAGIGGSFSPAGGGARLAPAPPASWTAPLAVLLASGAVIVISIEMTHSFHDNPALRLDHRTAASSAQIPLYVTNQCGHPMHMRLKGLMFQNRL